MKGKKRKTTENETCKGYPIKLLCLQSTKHKLHYTVKTWLEILLLLQRHNTKLNQQKRYCRKPSVTIQSPPSITLAS